MKKLFVLFSLVIASEAFASMASIYNCTGLNKVTKESVQFQVEFSNSDPHGGFTRQVVVITRVGEMDLKKPVIYQMYGATSENACKKVNRKEIYLDGKNFSMDSAKDGDLAPYVMSFKQNCGQNQNFDVKGYCFTAFAP